MNGRVLLAIVLVYAAAVAVVGQERAEQCTAERNASCVLPNCRCSGTSIPGGFPASNTPQMVFLTFDDAVTISNYPFYKEIFSPNRKNPNGERITGTFYVTHEYTNYSQVYDLWADGNEIALHSLSHTPPATYWANLNETGWQREVVDQRTQMAQFARIAASEIKGFRSPFLQTGADTMYKVLNDARFTYECTRPTLQYREPGLWPYTNDYQSIQDCQIAPCPVNKHAGFWTVPMIDLIGDNFQGCAMVDTCEPAPETADATFDLLMRNFNAHYNGNRAPYGLFAHAGWFNGTGDGDEIEERRRGYERFIDTILSPNYGDVYIVSVARGLEWVKTPQSLDTVKNFAAWKVTPPTVDRCPRTYTCHYRPEQTPFPTERYMHSCVACPPLYPWLGNPLGRA